MTDAITILGMAGSLRQNSFNAALLRAAAAAAPAGCTPAAHWRHNPGEII
jgi:NAD(P)H-dependent FMN reductase